MEELETKEEMAEALPSKRRSSILASKSRPAMPREGSKKRKLVEMLKRKSGTRVDEIMERFGWQSHTVRGFLSTLQKVGLVKLTRTRDRKGRSVYRAA